eukprot:TRINITY_DN22152_c0_g1_i1.p1 TRINITY_DN22152_c0_g1~~TRINITY_DN22152_c0_g1_i1.p1  ORF type:complete len:274 (+),score=56.63 TRINITY_DN22152_c0_g1_i1:120-824(+)
MGVELLQVLKNFEEDPNVRVVVLTGEGKYFCTGMDLSSTNQSQMNSSDGLEEAAQRSLDLFLRIRDFPKPIIARINGPALGGGLGLVFATDIRVSTDKAWFWFAEVKRGIVPALISSVIVPQLGAFHSKQFMITGSKISAAKGKELRFLSDVVPEEALDKVVSDYALEILTSAPNAIKDIKQTVNFVDGNLHQENIKYVKEKFKNTVHSEEAIYGMYCFAQKKTPDWDSIKPKL